MVKSLFILLKRKKSEIESLENELTKKVLEREIEILQFLSKDVWRIRIEKIIAALLNEDEIRYNNLLPHEKKIIPMIKNLFSAAFMKDIDKYITEGEEGLESVVDEKINLQEKEIEYELLLANDDIPIFIGSDGLIYRGISKGDLLMMPKFNYIHFKRIKLTKIK